MSRPHNQISRLRVSNSLKFLVPRVEFERARIRVLKTRTEIHLMNKVRTVLSAGHRLVLIPRCIHDRPPFLRTHQSGIRPRSLRGSCTGIVSLSLRIHLGLGGGNGTCSERNWPYGQSKLAVEDTWLFLAEFEKWVRCSKFFLIHRN